EVLFPFYFFFNTIICIHLYVIINSYLQIGSTEGLIVPYWREVGRMIQKGVGYAVGERAAAIGDDTKIAVLRAVEIAFNVIGGALWSHYATPLLTHLLLFLSSPSPSHNVRSLYFLFGTQNMKYVTHNAKNKKAG